VARVEFHPVLARPEAPGVSFSFEGTRLSARPGEMIASALFANGIRTFNLHPTDGAPQGIFCANGQCAQCMVVADDLPVKACMEPVREGMDVRRLVNLPRVPLDGGGKISFEEIQRLSCDLLVIGAGPAGLGAAIEAADAGLEVLVVDDKDRPGGKLLLQTHPFFGSVEQCHAGTRGVDLAALLAVEAARRPRIRVLSSTLAVGVYYDGKVGLVTEGRRFLLVTPRSLLAATGAREKALVFPGCDLPGVYGAGAFQTLLNRDLVRPADRLLIVGGGNVGLIAAYHALQAGIQVVGVIEGLPEVGGYWVHADKIRRFGVPIHTSTTVVCANGRDSVESVTVASVDERWNIRPGSYRTYACDTLLLAVGLEPVNELFEMAKRYGFDAHAAGDAEEIAEASAAMFSGRLAGRRIARGQGKTVDIPADWEEMIRILKSKPGREDLPVAGAPTDADVFPVISCVETIPCNPCTAVCPQGAIRISDSGDIRSRADFAGTCLVCGKCVAACPGLAITLVDLRGKSTGKALVTLPYEFPSPVQEGSLLPIVARKGEPLGSGKVVQVVDKLARAPCSAACPAGVRAQGYIELIRKRRFREAFDLLSVDLPLPSVCSRVCYHPCELKCARSDLDAPVSVLGLKRFVTDWAMEHDEPALPAAITHPERIAVVGSGPSGLACANAVLRSGYRVTVFESAPLAGGMLRYGIPDYRLPDSVLEWDLRRLQDLGIEMRTGSKVDSPAQLRSEGFAAVYLASGAQRAARLGVPGEQSMGVADALSFLREAGMGVQRQVRGSVAVVGGGNSALDAARTALRLGAHDATIVYRRSGHEMPANEQEVLEAQSEGVCFDFLAAPARIEETAGRGIRLVCTRMKLGETDASGRRRPIPVPGSEFVIKADLVIIAVGQVVDVDGLAAGLERGPSQTIAVDPLTQATSLPGVFAGGDAATGPATVVEAFDAGKRAAESILRYLTGGDLREGRLSELPAVAVMAPEKASRQPRREAVPLSAEARLRGFQEILPALDEQSAVAEAERCLGCGVYSENLHAAASATRRTRESTRLLTLEVEPAVAARVAGVRIQDESVTTPIATVMPPETDDSAVVCRCERVTLGQIRNALRSGVSDMNQLKAMLKTGLGACGGKTCGPLIQSIFRREGVPAADVVSFTQRPLLAEVPLGVFAGARRADAEQEGTR